MPTQTPALDPALRLSVTLTVDEWAWLVAACRVLEVAGKPEYSGIASQIHAGITSGAAADYAARHESSDSGRDS